MVLVRTDSIGKGFWQPEARKRQEENVPSKCFWKKFDYLAANEDFIRHFLMAEIKECVLVLFITKITVKMQYLGTDIKLTYVLQVPFFNQVSCFNQLLLCSFTISDN